MLENLANRPCLVKVFIFAQIDVLHPIEEDELVGNVIMFLEERTGVFVANFSAARNKFLKTEVVQLKENHASSENLTSGSAAAIMSSSYTSRLSLFESM